MPGVAYAHGILSAKGPRLSFTGIFPHQVMVIEFGVPQKKRGDIAITMRKSGFFANHLGQAADPSSVCGIYTTIARQGWEGAVA